MSMFFGIRLLIARVAARCFSEKILKTRADVTFDKRGAVLFEVMTVKGEILDAYGNTREETLWITRRRCTNPAVLRQYGLA